MLHIFAWHCLYLSYHVLRLALKHLHLRSSIRDKDSGYLPISCWLKWGYPGQRLFLDFIDEILSDLDLLVIVVKQLVITLCPLLVQVVEKPVDVWIVHTVHLTQFELMLQCRDVGVVALERVAAGIAVLLNWNRLFYYCGFLFIMCISR